MRARAERLGRDQNRPAKCECGRRGTWAANFIHGETPNVHSFSGSGVRIMALPTANTTLGWIAGSRLAEGTSQFLGLQYAASERWRPPVDRADPYSGRMFLASTFGPSCPQGPGQIYNSSDTSEDCLYLNVWAPATSGVVTPTKSVMVWIHGGCFQNGGAINYDASDLALFGDVIVVLMVIH